MKIQVQWNKGGEINKGVLVQFILDDFYCVGGQGSYPVGVVIDAHGKFVLIPYADLTFVQWL